MGKIDGTSIFFLLVLFAFMSPLTMCTGAVAERKSKWPYLLLLILGSLSVVAWLLHWHLWIAIVLTVFASISFLGRLINLIF